MGAVGMGGIGLVLGAGGATGGAFHGAVLAALAEVAGWDARTASVIVGTSAGSVAGTSLRAGLPPADLVARALGRPLSDEGNRVLIGAGVGGPISPPRRPSFPRAGSYRPAAPSALAAAARRPWTVRPGAMAAALLPEGRIDPGIAPMVDALLRAWPADPLWICAVDVGVGRRVVFGRDGDQGRASVGQAVAASCAIPGWFQPVTIGNRRYVDGAVHSTTNLDLLAGRGLDLVVVSVPMGGRTAAGALVGAQVRTEAAIVERRGTPVVVFQPTADDRGVMGVNAMDMNRRAAVAEQVTATMRARLARPDIRARLGPLGVA